MVKISLKPKEEAGRTPSILASLLVLGVMIALVLFSAAFFGGGVAQGPLQVSLTLATIFALFVAHLHGFSYCLISQSIKSSVSGTLGTLFVVTAIGALIGSLYLSGTVATFIYYGVALVNPKFYYITVFIIAAFVSMVIGSAATVAGMVGVAFVGLASAMGVSPAISAGAVVSGAIVGFTATRMSPVANLAISATSTNDDEYSPTVMRVVIPGVVLNALLFLFLGLTGDNSAAVADQTQVQVILSEYFAINLWAFLPLILILVLSALRFTTYLSLMLPAIFAVVLAAFTQHDLIVAQTAGQGLGYFQAFFQIGIDTLGNGFQLQSGVETLDNLFAGGGIYGMMSTVWLIMAAASFGAVMEYTGMLKRIITPIIELAKGPVSLILITMLTSIGLNAVMADPYGSTLLGASAFRQAYKRYRLRPVILSVAMASSGSAFSNIVPWNLMGALLAGTLGLATTAWAPYTFMAYLTPVVAFVIALITFRKSRVSTEDVDKLYGQEPKPPSESMTDLA